MRADVSGRIFGGEGSPNDRAGLEALAKAVSDPSRSQYRQYLSHAAYMSRFARTSAQVSAVTTWLKGAGLTVDSVGADHHYVAVSGPASAIQAAFGSQLATYTVGGEQAVAPASDPSVTDAVAGPVLPVTGLSRLGHEIEPSDLGAPAGFVNAPPCSS